MVSDTFQIPLTRSWQRFSSLDLGKRTPAKTSLPLRSFYGGVENQLVEFARHTLLTHRKDPQEFVYNPLFLCGGAGTGKSFLAHCFAGLWLDAENSKSGPTSAPADNRCRILLTTGADWARSFAEAIRQEQVTNWRATCRHASLFVLDDVQQLVRRKGAQQELIHLMDEFRSLHIPMVITSHHQPAMLEQLNGRLTSRLSAGLVIDLQPPSLESRKAIVRALSDQQDTQISDEAIDWFSETYRGTVPVLQNMLFGALAEFAVVNPPQTTCIDKPTLRRMVERWESAKKMDLSDIVRVVSHYTRISRKDMIGSTRKQAIVQARSLAMYLAKEVYGYSLREIGNHFSGRDHTTVLHACNKIHERASGDPPTKQSVEELKRMLAASRPA